MTGFLEETTALFGGCGCQRKTDESKLATTKPAFRREANWWLKPTPDDAHIKLKEWRLKPVHVDVEPVVAVEPHVHARPEAHPHVNWFQPGQRATGDQSPPAAPTSGSSIRGGILRGGNLSPPRGPTPAPPILSPQSSFKGAPTPPGSGSVPQGVSPSGSFRISPSNSFRRQDSNRSMGQDSVRSMGSRSMGSISPAGSFRRRDSKGSMARLSPSNSFRRQDSAGGSGGAISPPSSGGSFRVPSEREKFAEMLSAAKEPSVQEARLIREYELQREHSTVNKKKQQHSTVQTKSGQGIKVMIGGQRDNELCQPGCRCSRCLQVYSSAGRQIRLQTDPMQVALDMARRSQESKPAEAVDQRLKRGGARREEACKVSRDMTRRSQESKPAEAVDLRLRKGGGRAGRGHRPRRGSLTSHLCSALWT